VPLPAQASATIYPDGRVFIRRTIVHPIGRGTTVVPLPMENALPASLVALDSGVTITSVRISPFGDELALLRRMVGRRVVFRQTPPGDTVSALVLSADPPRYQLADGSVALSLPGTILYPADVVAPGQFASMTVQSDRPRSRVDVGYLITGGSWQAFYSLELGGGRSLLGGSVGVAVAGVALDSAEIVLLDGNLPTVSTAAGGFPEAGSPRFGDSVFLYRVPGRHTIRPGEQTTLPLFSGTPVEVTRVLSVAGMLSVFGPGQSVRVAAGVTRVPTESRYRVTRAAGSARADALPRGVGRVYRRFGPAGLTLIGGAVVARAAPGEPMEFAAGPSGDVVATRTTQESRPLVDTVMSVSGSRTVRTIASLLDQAIRLQNRTDSAVVVEVTEQRWEPWSVESSSVPPERIGPASVRFRIVVRPRGEETFTARFRVPVL
jgi:hypothetical protein